MIECHPFRTLAAAVLLCLWPTGEVTAQEKADTHADSSMILDRSIVLSGMPRERFLAHVEKSLRKFDRDRDGITMENIEKYWAQSAAANRERKVKFAIRHDLNGDGQVTVVEIERTLRQLHKLPDSKQPDARITKQIETRTRRIMQDDTDGDAIVTFEEIRSKESGADQKRNLPHLVKLLLDLDPNKDGRVTMDEVATIVDAAYKRHDKNGDGQIDADEKEPLAALKHAMMDKTTKSCALPKPDAKDHVIVFGSHGGAGLSAVTAGAQDAVTTTGNLVIEPGEKPLYVVLSSQGGVIWQFEGATERVSRAVVIIGSRAPPEASGVAGIEKAKVFFAKRGTCPAYLSRSKDPIESKNRAAFQHILGGPVDLFAGTFRLETGYLPSGKVDETKLDRATRARLAEDFVQGTFKIIYPNGLSKFEPASIVAEKPAKRYSILPSFAGLRQLLKDGAIEIQGDQKNRQVRVIKPIERFPAGFEAGRFANFVLAPDIPMPKTDFVYPCVMSEVTGKPVEKSGRCRMPRR